eukprot:Rmarinus@m.16459
MNLFGKAKKTQAQNPGETIAKMKETLNTMEKRSNHLNKRIDQERLTAKQMLAKKQKPRAMLALKKKKMLETQQQNVSNQVYKLESMIHRLEEMHSNIGVFQAMQQGNQAMKSTMRQLNVDNVDKVMDELHDNFDRAQEVTDVLAQPVGEVDIDDDDIMAELAELEGEIIDEQMLQTPVPSVKVPDASREADILGEAPAVPTHVPEPATANEEDELAKLEMMMA